MIVHKLVRLHVNICALFIRGKSNRRAFRSNIMNKYAVEFKKHFHYDSEIVNNDKFSQNSYFPLNLEKSEKIIIILIPSTHAMSGGIFSLFSIAMQIRKTKMNHGYDVVVMTRPNKKDLTYFRNINFVNSENIFRFEQIIRFKNARELYIHIPEYATTTFYENLTEEQLDFLSNLDRVDINILNQNIKLMPKFEQYKNLKKISNNLTQSVAHHAYFTQEVANRYRLPTLFLPAYTDISQYPKTIFKNKEKLIIYSPDNAPFKTKVLNKIVSRLPEFKLLEIKDITFDTFMGLATRCMFSISFGEGFDGYIAQPIYQGGLGITIYNDDFFPSKLFKQYPIFFESSEDMLNEICEVIQYFSSHSQQYDDLNQKLVSEYDKLYSYEEYVQQIKKLTNKEFELLPAIEI